MFIFNELNSYVLERFDFIVAVKYADMIKGFLVNVQQKVKIYYL